MLLFFVFVLVYSDLNLQAAEALKLATGPYKAARDAYVAAGKLSLSALHLVFRSAPPDAVFAASTYTKSLYE
jgi:hypothetical protein